MSSTPIAEDGSGYLRAARATVVAALQGLDDYDIRRPMTPTGTNLLGVVKHLIGIEAGYLGACLGRPFPRSLPWLADGAPANADMWATAEESRELLLELYRQATTHSDENIARLGLDSPAEVPWWPPGSRRTTSGAILMRVLKDTAMHAGQVQVLRELIDGRGGSDKDALGDGAWWRAHTDRLDLLAATFRSPHQRAELRVSADDVVMREASVLDASLVRHVAFAQLSEAEVVAMLERSAGNPDETSFLVLVRGRPAAVATLTRRAHRTERHRATIGGFVIATPWRGTGLARVIVELLGDAARTELCATILELTVRGRTHAESAYRGLGFREWGRLPGGMDDRGTVYDQVLMYRALDV